jgi:protein-L-isoaspartate(D-aspartate) O-methyltransferase
MDFTLARKNMVDGQLTPNKIVNAGVIERFLKVPREYFVDGSSKKMAYKDNPVKISNDRYMFPPMVTAHMIQALAPQNTDDVLVVASGTGYSASILCNLVNNVYGVENNLSLLEIGRRALLDASCKSVSLCDGKPEEGLKEKAPYSKILIDTAVGFVPKALFEQLKEGGSLVAIIQENEIVSCLKKFEKKAKGKIVETSIREVVAIPTHNHFMKNKKFSF